MGAMFGFYVPRHMTTWRQTTPKTVLRYLTTHRSVDGHSGELSRSPAFSLICATSSRRAVSRGRQPHAFFRGYTTKSLQEFARWQPIVLRDACSCSQCVDPSTRQREFNYVDIPTDISIRSLQQDPKTSAWTATWSNDIPGLKDHRSVFDESILKQLVDNVAFDVGWDLSVWDRQTFTAETEDIDYNSLLDDKSTLSLALKLIQKHGLVFVTGIPKEEEAVKHMVTRLCGLYRNTFYGESWNVRSVPQAKNVAYTSKILGFHMDLLYMREPPGLQLLHCLENTCSGGESQFADTFRTVDILEGEHSEYTNALRRHQVQYGYTNDSQSYACSRPIIQDGCRRDRPTRRITGAKNLDMIEALDCTFWSPPFLKSIEPAHQDSQYGSESKASAHDDVQQLVQASRAFAEIMQRQDSIYETKLPPGTCAVFDNLRVVHARKAFDMNSGKRWLKGIYGDRQDLLSQSLQYIEPKPIHQED